MIKFDFFRNFYEENKDKYVLPEWAAVEHVYCAAPLFGKWLRLQILENHDCEVVCLLLDFGIFSRFPKKGLHYIHSEFAKLPCQTFEGKLAFCIPPEKINREAEKYFEKKIKGVVSATVVRVDDVSNFFRRFSPIKYLAFDSLLFIFGRFFPLDSQNSSSIFVISFSIFV